MYFVIKYFEVVQSTIFFNHQQHKILYSFVVCLTYNIETLSFLSKKFKQNVTLIS